MKTFNAWKLMTINYKDLKSPLGSIPIPIPSPMMIGAISGRRCSSEYLTGMLQLSDAECTGSLYHELLLASERSWGRGTNYISRRTDPAWTTTWLIQPRRPTAYKTETHLRLVCSWQRPRKPKCPAMKLLLILLHTCSRLVRLYQQSSNKPLWHYWHYVSRHAVLAVLSSGAATEASEIRLQEPWSRPGVPCLYHWSPSPQGQWGEPGREFEHGRGIN